MKLVKSLLLGSAAGLVAMGGAQAADLPSRKAAPVEYVRVCSVMGAGFFYIPGTETCLRVGGRIRAEYQYAEPIYTAIGNGRSVDATGFRARGRLNIDARTATEYGLLRTFLRYEITHNSGPYSAGFNGSNSVSTALDKGFIQFGGLTAGRVQSFFDFYANDLNWGLTLGSDRSTQALAYTATFGPGFSATLALEDRTERQTVAPAVAGLAPLYGGTRMPDVVANLRMDSGWGSAQLSGALHQINTPNNILFGSADSEYGWAIQAGVKVKLDMLAPGDVFWLQAAYADGAASYIGAAPTRLGALTGYATGYDFAYNVNGGIEKTTGWSIIAAFLHYWSPTIRQGVFGGYNRYEVDSDVVLGIPGIAFTGSTGIAGVGAFAARDLSVWQIGTNVIWSPVKDLDIGVEVGYTNVDPSGRVAVAGTPVVGGLPVYTRGSEDQFYGRLRVQRDF